MGNSYQEDLVVKALQLHFESLLIAQMREEPFSLAVDGSNNSGIQKMNSVIVRIYDSDTGRIGTRYVFDNWH